MKEKNDNIKKKNKSDAASVTGTQTNCYVSEQTAPRS